MDKFSHFFKLSENERKGYLLLLLFIFMILSAPLVYRALRPSPAPDAYSLTALQDLATAQEAGAEQSSYSDVEKTKKASGIKSLELFYFNPNKLAAERWRKLGFSDRQIQVIHNYEARGGYFAEAADLAKIYSISAADFQRIAPYLIFDSSAAVAKTKTSLVQPPASPVEKTFTPIDINQADSLALIRLRGIGPVYSSRILKYRESLGGFYQLQQLQEVYGITAELYEDIQPLVFITSSPTLRKIPINTVLAQELAKHPYFSKKSSQILVNYRLQHGSFKNIKDLNIIYAFDSIFLRKIEPYLSFN